MVRRLHVAIISDLETQGGAAIATSRLAEGLVRQGVRVTRLITYPTEETYRTWESIPLRPQFTKASGLRRRLLLKRNHQPRLPALAARLDIRTAVKWIQHNSPDVVSLHNVHYGGWTASLVEQLVARIPVVWTLHDMWSFTGRCTHSMDCEKYIRGCDAACPTPHEYPRLHPARITGAWEQKRRLLSGSGCLVGVCPSDWLAKQAKRGLWRFRRVEVIRNGIELANYFCQERHEARRALEMSSEKPVLAAVLDQSAEGRKGEALLAAALNFLDTPSIAAVFGQGYIDISNPSIDLRRFGYLTQAEDVCRLLSAADLFVFASLAENCPQIVMEAMASGTPTLSYSIGGLPELIEPDVTGWLVPQPTADDLFRTLRQILETRSYQNMTDSCRQRAKLHFSQNYMTTKYIELFEDVLNTTKYSL